MTHDELLAVIDSWIAIPETVEGDRKTWKAIRAVMELHKPVRNALPDETCLACQDFYPCPTIEAIEKELK